MSATERNLAVSSSRVPLPILLLAVGLAASLAGLASLVVPAVARVVLTAKPDESPPLHDTTLVQVRSTPRVRRSWWMGAISVARRP
jgi:hypothetical protein